MALGKLVCVFRRHRYAAVGGEHAGAVLIRCGRCGNELVISAETFEAESWSDRAFRGSLAEQAYWHPDLDTQIRRRR